MMARKIYIRNIAAGVFLAALLLFPALPVLAQNTDQFRERGEWMMDLMLGDRRQDFDRDIQSRYGDEFVGRMHESFGRMGVSRMGWGGIAPTGMMGMMSIMSGWGGTSGGSAVTIGWLWAIVWTVNSVLLGILLWVLIRRFLK